MKLTIAERTALVDRLATQVAADITARGGLDDRHDYTLDVVDDTGEDLHLGGRRATDFTEVQIWAHIHLASVVLGQLARVIVRRHQCGAPGASTTWIEIDV